MIYVGIATYDGKLHHSTVGGLFNTAYGLGKARHGLCLDVIPHDPNIGHARSLMVERFLSTDATDCLMIDADVGFSFDDFDKIMGVDADVVCGVYPYKTEAGGHPVAPVQPVVRRGHLVKVHFGPGGFLRIRRRVLEKLALTAPVYDDTTGQPIREFFTFSREGRRYRSEDVNFYRAAIAAGFECWALEGLNLKHTGEKTYEEPWFAPREARPADVVPVPEAA